MEFHSGTLPEFRGCWILDIGAKFNPIFDIISGIGGTDIKHSPIFLFTGIGLSAHLCSNLSLVLLYREMKYIYINYVVFYTNARASIP